VRVYTDGSCRDGVGGWAWWNPETKEWRKGSEVDTTNQQMELTAALEAVNHHYEDKNLVIVSDSKYVVNCFGERWWVKWLENGWVGSNKKGISNRNIWEPLLEMVRQHGNIKFEWVKGHSGDPDNDKADELALGAVITREKEIEAGKAPEKDAKVFSMDPPEEGLTLGTDFCSYCGKAPKTHFMLLVTRTFVAACKKHSLQLRMPLQISEEYDEHPWGEYCNKSGSSWNYPIEKEVGSFCAPYVGDYNGCETS
jgi:ribonuclease HI